MNINVKKMMEGLHGLQGGLRKLTDKNGEAYASLSKEEKKLVDFATKDLSFKDKNLDQISATCSELLKNIKH